MSVTIDRTSLLVDVSGETALADVEAALVREGLTLDVERDALAFTAREWLDRGAPGARDRWLDPADQLLAGLDATLKDGGTLSIRPAPRRATGPDLVALVVGCSGRFASVTRVWLRVHVLGVARPTAPFDHPRDPPMSDEESALVAAFSAELAAEAAKSASPPSPPSPSRRARPAKRG